MRSSISRELICSARSIPSGNRTWCLRAAPRSASGVRKRLRYDLELIFVYDVSNTVSLQHSDRNTMMFQNDNQFAHARKMFMRSILEPRDRHIFLAVVGR